MRDKLTLMIEGLIALLLLVLVAQGIESPGSSIVGSQYQAVVMSDGQIYFGKLEKLESDWPVLRDVYFVQQRGTDEQGRKEQVIVKRSAVLHLPDHMVINGAQIRFVEPVSERSKMMQLIRAAGARQAEMLDEILGQNGQ